MKHKRLLLIAGLLAVSLALAACAPKPPAATATPAPTEVPVTEAPATEVPATEVPATEAPAASEPETLELTVEELAKYNGKDGQPAYIAVDGVIYDVSNHPAWKDGGHNGFEAGKDLTEEIKTKSPHGVAKLTQVTEVGKLVTP